MFIFYTLLSFIALGTVLPQRRGQCSKIINSSAPPLFLCKDSSSSLGSVDVGVMAAAWILQSNADSMMY